MPYYMNPDSELREVDGTIIERRRGTRFVVETVDGDRIVAELTAALWRNELDVLPGDRVRVQFDVRTPLPGRILANYRIAEAAAAGADGR